MPKYKVQITQDIIRCLDYYVEAPNKAAAHRMIKDMNEDTVFERHGDSDQQAYRLTKNMEHELKRFDLYTQKRKDNVLRRQTNRKG